MYEVVPRPITADEVLRAVEHEDAGGLVTFTGRVRRHSRGREVVRLEYEAYVPMAVATLRDLGEQAAARWPGVRCAIAHRIGVLAIGDVAVAIAVAAPHRAEAFEACRWLIDRLKEVAPIWKKEVDTTGETWVGLGP
jgi:molybdopterin synthase catalytic subunit